MLVELTLKSLLNPLVAGGCHTTINTRSPIVTPYVVTHELSGVPVNGLVGYMGITDCSYQIDTFAASPEQAKDLAMGVIKTAIEESTVLQGILTFKMSGQYSELDKTFQYITEYQLWIR